MKTLDISKLGLIPLNYVQELIRESIYYFNLDQFDKIYGVPRAGIYLASLICQSTGAELVIMPNDAELIVDDIVSTGKTISEFSRYKGKLFSLFVEDDAKNLVDFYLTLAPNDCWLIFPWDVDDLGVLPFVARHTSIKIRFKRGVPPEIYPPNSSVKLYITDISPMKASKDYDLVVIDPISRKFYVKGREVVNYTIYHLDKTYKILHD